MLVLWGRWFGSPCNIIVFARPGFPGPICHTARGLCIVYAFSVRWENEPSSASDYVVKSESRRCFLSSSLNWAKALGIGKEDSARSIAPWQQPLE